MDQEYDRKFEEMKKYIPFLESMIKRLENNTSASNPRQAQLDKIRSLRDLLLDKKKRMKMENLLKCEQVLVNLYSKVEQKEALPDLKSPSDPIFPSKAKETADNLDVVRNKLKIVSTKIQDEQDTLPEIARASATEEDCTPGSKEPALFQRRPNKVSSVSPAQKSSKSPNNTLASKRNYTRVLVSPEPGSARWKEDEPNLGMPLFSRRSPKHSPTYPKKERKKSVKRGQLKKAKDLNITLNVPEDSLDSLNTKDILTRIMNCSDTDVDIETLREAKRQILNELKQTGAKCDDISDLLLKSYEKKKKKKKNFEVEEGELSDSESEAIQSIYGNFILEGNNKDTSEAKNADRNEKPRKIQICLVINPENEKKPGEFNKGISTDPHVSELTDFEMYDDKPSCTKIETADKSAAEKGCITVDDKKSKPPIQAVQEKSRKEGENEDLSDASNKNTEEVSQPANFYKPLNNQEFTKCASGFLENDRSKEKDNTNSASSMIEKETPLISKPQNESELSISSELAEIGDKSKTEIVNKKEIEIPLLHEPSIATQKPKANVVSEIDILQALKNEILSESLSIPGSETTPLLHQPKLTKVSSVQEIVPKKRISIEKYKKKSEESPKNVFSHELNRSSKDDNLRKQSLKLTEKECERFNFPAKLAFENDESEEDDESNKGKGISEDVLENLVPKSPDENETQKTKCIPPVIIPVEPVKTPIAPSKADIDMRMFISMLSPNLNTPATNTEDLKQIRQDDVNTDHKKTSFDPRIRRDYNQPVNVDNSNMLNKERKQGQFKCSNIAGNITPMRTPNITTNVSSAISQNILGINPCMTPTRAPHLTPSRNPNMTPNARTYDVSRQNFEMDDSISARKHVYAPSFPLYDQRENREHSLIREQEQRPYWDKSDNVEPRRNNSRWNNTETPERDPRSNSIQRDTYNNYDKHNRRYNSDRRDSFNRSECPIVPYSRSDCPNTPSHPFGRVETSTTRMNPFSWSDCPTTPSHQFGRLDCPQTPNHPFGRSDCPQTPNQPFGRSDCPQTPNHPFGRADCPPTPSHPFGRSDCPQTSSHPFGRSDCPSTPIHPFGRSDMPMTPSHPFGRPEIQSRDPRLNRSSDYDNVQNDDRDRQYYRDHGRSNYNRYNKSDSQQKYTEQSIGRNDRNNLGNRNYSKDQSFRRDNRESGNYYTGDGDLGHRKNFYRERSIGRSVETNDRIQRSSSRARSVGSKHEDTENKLSITPHTGKSFIIDTSIKSTFQDFLKGSTDIKTFDYKFDRRKRAASVGRVLCREPDERRKSHIEFSERKSFHRESSVGRSLHYESRHTFDIERNHFRRARSVGRDITTAYTEKSLKDIKVDFENYKASYDSRKSKALQKPSESEINSRDKNSAKESNHWANTKRKEDMGESGSKKTYHTVQKHSDPRIRRDNDNHHSRNRNDNSRERNRKNVGLVYSNDNITKGKILGSGYGVKNYKIPKIKRPVDEENNVQDDNTEQVKTDLERSDEQNIKNKILKSKSKPGVKEESKKDVGKLFKQKDDIDKTEKRVTRLSRKNDTKSSTEVENDSQNTIVKCRKVKKPLIYDSDSDSTLSQTEEKKMNIVSVTESESDDTRSEMKTERNIKQQKTFKSKETLSDEPTSAKIPISIEKESKEIKENKNIEQHIFLELNENTKTLTEETFNTKDLLESTFSMDDIEIFSDNIASDSVIDNINALIANLDSDLEPPKVQTSTNFTKDLTFENILKNIESDEKDNLKTLSVGFNNMSDIFTKDSNQSTDITNQTESIEMSKTKQIGSPIKSQQNKVFENRECKDLGILKSQEYDVNTKSKENNSDNLVSTTDIDKKKSSEKSKAENIEQNIDSSAAPDSTNEIIAKKSGQEGIPDSTNGTQNDTSSMVTSSYDSSETIIKDNEISLVSNNEATSISSIGSILSILQDKTKLKEILNMLGDQSSENEKIKKKLKKMSEIVSDDDDVEETARDLAQEQEKPLLSSPKESDDKNDGQDHNKTMDIQENVNKPTEETKVVIPKDNVSDETNKLNKTKKVPVKRGKVGKRRKGKFSKKVTPGLKRITRSGAKEMKPKKPSRELLQLQEDIKEMFISDDVLNASGIRMCRLAKLIDDKTLKSKDDMKKQDSTEPVVVLEKFKETEKVDETRVVEKINKKKKFNPKGKSKLEDFDDVLKATSNVKSPKYKPGPKSKTKPVHKSDDEDPYAFESDSLSEFNFNTKFVEDKEIENTESENESIESSKSYGSSDLLMEVKKKSKRKKSGWQAGIIKPKSRKKKTEVKQPEIHVNDGILIPQKTSTVPDLKCFTDKSYCFQVNVFTYSCRLCVYRGEDIVNHYKQSHPHTEIPLSRPSPDMAKQAIEQCEEINFQAISKMPSDKYVCRFCFKEFGKKKAALEAFFWHIVSMHTGEYKHTCTLCDYAPKCPFNLDIPAPPKDVKGQLIGYICEKCNFTQISLENLKTHVIVRHNDEQTEVYTINLAVMSFKEINALSKRCNTESEKQRVLRSSRLNQSVTETSDEHSDVTDSDISTEQLPECESKNKIVSPTSDKQPKKFQSKISFENDDNASETSSAAAESVSVKLEKEEEQTEDKQIDEKSKSDKAGFVHLPVRENIIDNGVPADIFAYPHFKVKYAEGGSKEYFCCINGVDNHYKTSLLISLKKHVQLKHSETWDGYCSMCKVIVTPQGKYKFQDCLQHYLDKHIDNLPLLENVHEKNNEATLPSKPYINVRPLSELLPNEVSTEEPPTFPKIESVMSLGVNIVEPPEPSPSYSPLTMTDPIPPEKEYKYEEVQAEVMSGKHCVVLTTMMSQNKLVNIFKCAGRFCSFTTDSAEDALLHASTHQRVGGENAMICAYCDFDCSGNAIDLVMHVFKAHSVCPYVCGYCFYRAASSQVVGAHINRIHLGKTVVVLSALNVTPPPHKGSLMLPREAVVQYYVCPHACKFRTYTAGKYCEHLLQRHSAETCHPCYICSKTFEAPVQLIQHMKDHDINVYQCTWCVHGASTENNLLYHASQKHPDRQPQAYLRVITNKDGSSEFRVLPLASFNKNKITVQEIIPNTANENPVREAERSIELEKLIGHTNQLIATMATTSAVEPVANIIDTSIADTTITEVEVDAALEQMPPSVSAVTETSTPIYPASSSSATPAPLQTGDTSAQVTPVLKIEQPDHTTSTHTLGEVVCLDSDEDEPAPNTAAPPEIAAIDKPSDPPAASKSEETKFKHVQQASLLRCAKCAAHYKSLYSFKKHIASCCPTDELMCAHCDHTVIGAEQLVGHYVRDHGEAKPTIACTECGMKFDSVAIAKRHLKYSHRAAKAAVTTKVGEDGHEQVLVSAAARRKRSAGAAPAPPPAPKMARYGPQDAHRLPINPILEDAVFCAVCEFKTKVRLNMVRHLQLHAECQPAPNTAPVNPVPHLETNEMHFDRMVNLASSSIATPAPTMDLKPWHCGLCAFLSMLRPEVVLHCSRVHQSKMQYKCMYCPFRTSACENVTKHQANSHPGKKEDVFYYYYREGSVPDEPDGTPRWKRQREKFGCPDGQPEVKSETVEAPAETSPAEMAVLTGLSPAPAAGAEAPDLNIVKREAQETTDELQQLFDTYGQPCAPNGIKYKCPLCKVVVDDSKETMRSHLYEELKYRRWACTICSYKAFHKTGLHEHITSEHRGQTQPPKLLPCDADIEKWVSGILEYQTDAINKSKENLAKQKIITEKPSTSTSSAPLLPKPPQEKTTDKYTMKELEQAFGPLGVPSNMLFCCPKCNHKVKEEAAMRDHLESELSRIRWCCSICMDKFQTYHEAQFHCKSSHVGMAARPVEASRDTALRAAWLAAVLQVQRLSMRCLPFTEPPEKPTEKNPASSQDTSDNSLLVVRYEENVSTPEESASRKRPAPSPDSDDERLVIDELAAPSKRKGIGSKCPYCDFTSKYSNCIKEHLYRHYNMKPFMCPYCDLTGHRSKIVSHLETAHELISKPDTIRYAPLPPGPPLVLNVKPVKAKKVVEDDRDGPKVVCLVCEKTLADAEVESHSHDKVKAEFASRGDIVVKCCICLALRRDVASLQEHHKSSHGTAPLNYAFFKFQKNTRDILCCGHCDKRFTYIKDIRTHHEAVHGSLTLKYHHIPYCTAVKVLDSDEDSDAGKRSEMLSSPVLLKSVARKSTSKLPAQMIARKSTTKLPFDYENESEYSFYGTKPSSLDDYENVTTFMLFCNTMVPFTVKKLNDILKINPVVLVEDIGNK